ncbi:MAG: ATP synthase F1 subunit gamma [Oscillospiraceae bacterium]|jgi:F-type H+-transporting ATPase subunit gamma|nr:ATP synthase F1 subunit gamma [Oscillospiraceae bacterium]
MPSAKEIKDRISSVRDTQKITNAMYLIASTKMRKAKADLDRTMPYFSALRGEIKRIFRTVGNIDSQYFFPEGSQEDLPGACGYLVITADKGLAGAYNQNAIREAQRLMDQHDDNKLFVVGEYGRQYFSSRGVPIEQSFLYTAQNPTLQRSRDICYQLLDRYRAGELVKIFVVYTDFSGLASTARSVRLLPFHHAHFASASSEKRVKVPFGFSPSVETVLDSIIPSYVTGFIYSALVDSFCSEQNERMKAMDAAGKNAQELLDDLTIQSNHMRQGAITQELTEISAGALGQRRRQERQTEGGNML